MRRKLGNLWQLTHGSAAGLGERLLQAFDHWNAETKGREGARNAGLKDPFAFVLRRPGNEPPLKLADWKGKVLVMNFWATWFMPCRVLEPLYESVARRFEGRGDVAFLAVNDD